MNIYFCCVDRKKKGSGLLFLIRDTWSLSWATEPHLQGQGFMGAKEADVWARGG